MPNTQTFTCGACGNEFEKGWADKEADAEYAEHFPYADAEGAERDTVCEDCYKKIMARAEAAAGRVADATFAYLTEYDRMARALIRSYQEAIIRAAVRTTMGSVLRAMGFNAPSEPALPVPRCANCEGDFQTWEELVDHLAGGCRERRSRSR